MPCLNLFVISSAWHVISSQEVAYIRLVILWQERRIYMLWSLKLPWMKVFVIPALCVRLFWLFILFIDFFWWVGALLTALEILVEKRITGFPVVDDDWKLVKCSLLCFFTVHFDFNISLYINCKSYYNILYY